MFLLLWKQVLLTGWTEAAKHELESWALELVFEFSLEYDLETARHTYRMERAEEQKAARPDDEVMKTLGFTDADLLK